MQSKPVLASGLFYSAKAAKHLFLNSEIPNWIVTNSNGALLLSKCDGKRTVAEIVASTGVPCADIERLFQLAAERGVIFGYPSAYACSAYKHGKPISLKPEASKHPQLRTVHLQLTNACNLSCRYCYAESGKASGHLSLEELFKIASDVSAISPSVQYDLSGGEPLLHPNVLDFAESVKRAGNTVHLLTNGTLLTASSADRICAFADGVRISIDGSTEAIHSLTRGSGHYATIINTFNLLVERGVNVTVSMTVHKLNVRDVEAMTHRFGSRLSFQPFFTAGRGKGNSDLALSGAEYYGALASVGEVSPLAQVGSILEGLRGVGTKRCALAVAEISISETGDIYPCQLLHSPQFLAGNFRETPLKEVYFNSPVFQKARSVSVDTLEKCKQCPVRLLCAGGCRARDFYEVGTIESVGNFCEYEQMAFLNGLLDCADF